MDVRDYFISRGKSCWCWFCRSLQKIKSISVRETSHNFVVLSFLFLFSISFFVLTFFFLVYHRRNRELVERLSKPNNDAKDLNFPTKYSKSFLDQFLACLWKQNLSYWRNPQYTAVRFFYTFIISLMLGTICWRFGSKRFAFGIFLSLHFALPLILEQCMLVKMLS